MATTTSTPQDLNPNAVATATLLNPSIPAAHPSAAPFLLPPRDFIARHFPAKGSTAKRPPAPHVLGTGAVVFNQPLLPSSSATNNTKTISTDHDAANSSSSSSSSSSRPAPPRILLVQRAPHDSMPLKWEVPGGGCDADDPSILYSCARELYEEAGLLATSVGPLVVCPSYSRSNLAKTQQQQQQQQQQGGDEDGLASAEDRGEEAEWGERMGGQFFFSRSGKLVCKFQFVVEVEQGQEVVLDPNEHVAYVWASEEECRRKEIDGNTNPEGMVMADGGRSEETRLEFASREQWDIVMKAFKLWGER